MSKKTQKGQKKRKSGVKHGIHFWLGEGRINPSIRGYKKLQKYLEDMESELIDLQGGREKLTAAQEILIKGTIEAYGVILLASMHCKKEGILRPDKAEKGIIELQPVLGQQFLAFLNTVRQNLLALGLEKKKTNDVLDVYSYIEKRDQEKQGESQGKKDKS